MPRPRDGIDPISKHFGFQWEAPNRIRLAIRSDLINAGGLLSGVVAYALVDYCMGSTLWTERNEGERIATIGISINYVQTATEGEIVCTSELDRRNDRVGVLRSEVRHDDGRLLATAVGSFSIFPERRVSGPKGPSV